MGFFDIIGKNFNDKKNKNYEKEDELAKHLKNDMRYDMPELRPTKKEHVVWMGISLGNLLLAVYNVHKMTIMYKEGLQNHEYFSLLQHYDGGNAFSFLFLSFVVLAMVYVYGFIATNNFTMHHARTNARVAAFSFLNLVKFAIIFIIALLIVTRLLMSQAQEITGVSEST